MEIIFWISMGWHPEAFKKTSAWFWADQKAYKELVLGINIINHNLNIKGPKKKNKKTPQSFWLWSD